MTGGGALRLACVSFLVLLGACARPPAAAPVQAEKSPGVREFPERPPVAVVVRDGDPRAALSVAVLTAGIDDASGPRVPVALAAVVLARLEEKGVRDATVAATWDGYRVRALIPKEGAAPLVRAIRDALLTPIASSGPELELSLGKLAALAHRPLRDAALLDVARCADEPFALPSDAGQLAEASPAKLEAWRAASHGLGRVVLAAAGSAPFIDGVTQALLSAPPWPSAKPFARAPDDASTRGAPLVKVYDASPEVTAASARATLVVHTPDPRVAVATARALGAPDGPLVARLRGLEMGASLRDVTATAGADGGCLAVALNVTLGRAADAENDARIAAVVALARQETLRRFAGGPGPSPLPAFVAADPREAAELAAWWTLVSPHPTSASPSIRDEVVVGLAGGVDKQDGELHAREATLTAALQRALDAWGKAVVDARVAIEPGQGALWILVASPCGTSSEGDADAGLTALAVLSLAEDAREHASDMDVSEWIASDGVGLVVRAVRHEGETSPELARRAADLAGATLAAWTLDPGDIGRARAALMDRLAKEDGARGYSMLAAALNPGHAAWDFPLGNGAGLEAWPDGAVLSRITALRTGPLRVAVLANDDAAQAEAAVVAVDRWIMRGPGERTCPPSSAPTPAKPGTYAAPSTATHDAWLAFPLPAADKTSHEAARVVAAALDGDDGLLARALASGLASSWGARVIGPAAAPALVVRVGSTGHALDAAVAQVRVLFDRLRQGSLTEADRAHATTLLAEQALRASLDPRGRLLQLWRGDPPPSSVPPLDALRGFLAQTFHDDALVIVAARPTPVKVP